ncbi:uncharacterized protein VTP21DRAFT_3825 [Calcarisporiella thermophila]|uniref:uncharacterized protein n=1 Tax=Calcarisporiella thermophila TaxID=911321 RepID=UPI003741FB8D
MGSLATFLQTELLTLSNESRRKNPEIKETAERLSAILRTHRDHPGSDIAKELARADEIVLRPFLLACETKHVKLVTIAIGCVQRLISYHAIPETSVKTILKMLNDVINNGVEIQLKILQTILPLLTNYHDIHRELLAEALLICFRLQDSKIVVVNNTAAATLRQLVIFLFDKVTKEDADAAEASGSDSANVALIPIEVQGEGTIELRPAAADAYCLFQDLCFLTNGEHATFLRLNSLSRTFGLELIESVLTNHHKLFSKHNEFCALLKVRLCPLIIKSFSDKLDFPRTMRLMRVVYILIKQFNEILIMECEIFLSMFVKILEAENPLWLRVLSMELFHGVCADFHLLRTIFRNYDRQNQSPSIFQDMMNAFGKISNEKPQAVGAGTGLGSHYGNERRSIDVSGFMSAAAAATGVGTPSENSPGLGASSIMKIQCIDQLDKIDPPAIPETYLYYLTLLTLNSIADGLASFVLPIFGSLAKQQARQKHVQSANTPNSSPTPRPADTPPSSSSSTFIHSIGPASLESHPLYKEVLLVTDMANVAWPGLLAAMTFFLSSNLDEELFQNSMRAYQNFTNVCGMLKLLTPRDAFLTNLCKVAVPPAAPQSMERSMSLTSIASAASGLTVGGGGDGSQPMTVLSEKNLFCLRVLLNIAQYLGGVLGDSWYLVLETLQRADHILFGRRGAMVRRSQSGLPAAATAGSTTTSSAGQAASKRPSAAEAISASSSSQSLIESDISMIMTTTAKLFENTKYLDDNAFMSFIKALCMLSAATSGIPLLLAGFTEEDLDTSTSGKTSFPRPTVSKTDSTSFAIEKLRFVSVLNMPRILTWEAPRSPWDFILGHLISTANYINTPSAIRLQTCQAIASIISGSMSHASSAGIKNDPSIQMRQLHALSQCIVTDLNAPSGEELKGFVEVQQMGLETLYTLLQTSGHSLTSGWGMIFDMIKSVCQADKTSPADGTPASAAPAGAAAGSPPAAVEESLADDRSGDVAGLTRRTSVEVQVTSEAEEPKRSLREQGRSAELVRVAFPCLQLICTDFLSQLSPDCLHQCINALGAFGLQTEDLNVSLTAIGLLWNVSDFIQTKRQEPDNLSPRPEETEPAYSGEEGKEKLDFERILSEDLTARNLWMLLLLQLSKLCSDPRPEVRNGANQTLFRTISMNGSTLSRQTWHICVWRVLFPLLDSVKLSAERAVREMHEDLATGRQKAQPSKEMPLLMHHSRATVDKQWDETKVLVLCSIAGIFNDFFPVLVELKDFDSAWDLWLSHLEDDCLRSSQEVSLAAIRSLRSTITLPADYEKSWPPSLLERAVPLWQRVWAVWEHIGQGISHHLTGSEDLDQAPTTESTALQHSRGKPYSVEFTQETLTAFVETVGDLYAIVGSSLDVNQLRRQLSVIKRVLAYPASPSYRPDTDHLSPLQAAALGVIERLNMDTPGAPPIILADLVDYMLLAFNKWITEQHKDRKMIDCVLTMDALPLPPTKAFASVTYIALAKRAIRLLAQLFERFSHHPELYDSGVFEKIIGGYGVPMWLKYECPPSYQHNEDIPLWKTATTAFMNVVKVGLPLLQQFGEGIKEERFTGVWYQFVTVMEGTLLTSSKPPTNMSIEDADTDEFFDISFLASLQADLLCYMGEERVPEPVVRRLVHVIERASRLYFLDDHQGDPVAVDCNAREMFEVEDPRKEQMLSGDNADTAIEGSTSGVVPVLREKFSYACFGCLFELCAERPGELRAGEPHEQATDKSAEGSVEARRRIARITAPALLERCAFIIKAFSADKGLLGRAPFPRVRHDEAIFVLKQLLSLRVQPGALDDLDTTRWQIKPEALRGSRAHLFVLYPILCEVLGCADQTIIGLSRECLMAMGEELGFSGLVSLSKRI